MRVLISVIITAAILMVSSCAEGEKAPDPVKDSLSTLTRDQEEKISERDSTIDSYLKAFNDIQDNLDVIKEKEKMISNSSQDAEMQKSQKDRIVEDIQTIYQLMLENKEKLEALNARLRRANRKSGELEKLVARLNTELAEKDASIAELNSKLEQINVEVSKITTEYQTAKAESEAKTTKLNTAYYAFGTSKELKEKGVITKEGGFIGMGKAEKLKDNFNKEYFTKIDISQTTSIPLAVKKVKVVTVHPPSSYKLEENGGKVEKLVIQNPEEFWGASKYLVIIVD